jgi:hypothetical protein
MILGAAMGAVLGLLHDGTPQPMGLLIGGLAVLSLLSCCLLIQPRSGGAKPSE